MEEKEMADNVDIQLLGKRVADLTTEVRVMDRAVQRLSVEMHATLASFRHEMLTGFDRVSIENADLRQHIDGQFERIEASNREVIALLQQFVPKG
jgi:hypothetical protein